MRRITFVLLTLFAFACVSFAQKSSGGASSGSAGSTGMSTGSASTGSVAGTTPTTTSTGQQTPLAPANPTTVNPGNPDAATGGSPLVPVSAVPTTNSNEQLNNATNSNIGGVGSTGGVGQVAPSFHLETQMPGAGVTANGTGSPAGVTNNGSPGNSSTLSGSVPVYDNPRASGSNNATSGPVIVDVAGDLAGMTFVNGGNAPAQQASEDSRSLGEVAAQYKRNRSVQAAHVYTNEDIDRLNARNDSGVMGPNQNVALPEGEGAPAQQQQPAVKRNQKRSPFTPQRPK